MVRGQRWRYWAHRLGILPSPSCTLMYVPYGTKKKSDAYYWAFYKKTGRPPLDVVVIIEGFKEGNGHNAEGPPG